MNFIKWDLAQTIRYCFGGIMKQMAARVPSLSEPPAIVAERRDGQTPPATVRSWSAQFSSSLPQYCLCLASKSVFGLPILLKKGRL